MFNHQLETLANGLQLLRIGLPAAASITTLVFSNTGSRYEQANEYGIAHFFEHMVFKGTPAYPDPQLLASAIDGIGADFNAFTSREYTGYYIKAASQHLDLTLDVLSDMLLRPLLKQEDLERERGVIIEEMNMYKDNPMHHIANVYEEMLWEGSGLSHDIIGTRETVTGVNRPDFVNFLSRWYGHGNLLIVLAGDEKIVMATSAREKVEKAFTKSPEHDRVGGKQQPEGLQPEGFVSSKRLLVIERPTEQAHLILGWKGLRRGAAQRHALSLLSVVLGGSMSSRLFTEVREKRGLCYYVSSDTEFYRETGFFGASAGVETKRVQEAIEVITAEFIDLATGKRSVTQEELDRAKEHVGGKMLLSFEDSRSVAQFYGMRQLLQDKIEDPDEVMRHIRAVTTEEIQALASQLLHQDEMRLGVIGPFKESEFTHFF